MEHTTTHREAQDLAAREVRVRERQGHGQRQRRARSSPWRCGVTKRCRNVSLRQPNTSAANRECFCAGRPNHTGIKVAEVAVRRVETVVAASDVTAVSSVTLRIEDDRRDRTWPDVGYGERVQIIQAGPGI